MKKKQIKKVLNERYGKLGLTTRSAAQIVHSEIAFRIRFYRNVGCENTATAFVELQRSLMEQGLSIFKP